MSYKFYLVNYNLGAWDLIENISNKQVGRFYKNIIKRYDECSCNR